MHCGTNVLHSTARGSRPPAYDVVDQLFRDNMMNFEEGETIEAVS